MRYKVVPPWTVTKTEGSYAIQAADLLDTQNGRTYAEGAMRVVKTSDMKPVKAGKGGTVPFKGECAWMDAERLLRDMAFAERVGKRY